MGGYRAQPFILFPAELPCDGDLVGAASVYRLGKGWLEQLRADTNDESIRLAAANGDGNLATDFVVSSVER